MPTRDEHAPNRFAAIRRRVVQWREEPWDLRPWAATTAPYRGAVIVTALVEIGLAITAATWLTFNPVSATWLTIAVVLTVFLSTSALRSSALQGEDAFVPPAVALAVSGHIVEACVACVIGATLRAIQKPLPLHLACANVVHVVALTVITCGGIQALAGAPEISMNWLALAAAVFAFTDICITLAIAATATLGGYGSLSDTVRPLARTQLTNLAATAPVVAITSALLAIGGVAMTPLLLLHRVLSFVMYKRQDEVVTAQAEALRDGLTGLPNRRALERFLEDNARPGMWVAICDLDNFKQVNDRYGHGTGDSVVAGAARLFTAHTATDALCARLGGDEFALIFPRHSASDVRRELQQALDAITVEFGFMGVACSVGIAEVAADSNTRSALAQADMAMYVAKHGGGNTILFHDDEAITDPANEHAAASSELEAADALAGGQRAYDYWQRIAASLAAHSDDPEFAHALYEQANASTRNSERDALLAQAADAGANGWATLARAQLDVRTGNAGTALELLNALRDEAHRSGDRLLELESMSVTTQAQWALGNFDGAIDHQMSLIERADMWHSKFRAANARLDLADMQLHQLRTPAALAAMHDARNHAQRHGITEIAETAAILEPIVARLLGRTPSADTSTDMWLDGALISEHSNVLSALRLRNILELGRQSFVVRTADELEACNDEAVAIRDATGSPLARLVARELGALASDDATTLASTARHWQRADMRRDAALCTLFSLMTTQDSRSALRADTAAQIAECQSELIAVGELGFAQLAGMLAQRASGTALRDKVTDHWLFSLAEPELRQRLRERAVPTRFTKGMHLIRHDEIPAAVGIIETGSVRLVRTHRDGKRLIFDILGPGAVIGEGALNGAESGFSVEAAEDTHVLNLRPEDLRTARDGSSELSRRLLELTYERAQRASDLAERIAYWSLQQRVAAAIVDLAASFGHPTMAGHTIVNRKVTGEELAELVGATRPAAAAEQTKLRNAGIISVERGKITILQVDRLKERARGASGEDSAAA